MGLLKPFSPDEVLDAVAGATKSPGASLTDLKDIKIAAKDIFDAEGADIQAAARAAYFIMQHAERESDRLRAAELVLKIQGAYDPDKVSQSTGITINIISSGEVQQNVLNLVMPQAN
jgi:hypothetical protein